VEGEGVGVDGSMVVSHFFLAGGTDPATRGAMCNKTVHFSID
jgi:hypothetical protein